MRRENQEDEDQAEDECYGRRAARRFFLAGFTGPFVAVTGRHQLAGDFLDGLQRLAGAVAGGGRAGDLDGRVVVEAGDQIGAGDVARLHHGRQRHHLAFAGADVDVLDVFGLQPEPRLGLQNDLPEP